MMNESLKSGIKSVTTKHNITCDWATTDGVFVGEYGTIFTTPNGNAYRVFVGSNLICFQYVDIDSGDVVDIYFNDNESDIVIKLDELITQYMSVTWVIYGDTNSLNYWYVCEQWGGIK